MPNKLINEQSPYLLQHAHNPVEWYPWCDEAFEYAKRENKPVLVSIGYSACHWCHVMERESFEDDTTAAYMNEHYVNIKVDREEHPDVDNMYMDAVQAITQSGGWPLNVFVTPERVPFYGGTYFPPKPLYGRPSWMQVLEQINNVWHTQQDEVTTQTSQMKNYLQQLSATSQSGGKAWGAKSCSRVADGLLKAADSKFGGFGSAPKFPAASSILYLLEHYVFTGNESALEHAVKSLDGMADGGIYDQLGGGFARYSTDNKWLAPHFEKMLYDNALLIPVYCLGYDITGDKKYKNLVVQTVDFINRELKNGEGGFCCALDADTEGVEGKYYTWTWEDWQGVIGDDDLLSEYFGVVEEGNWEGVNILHNAASVAALARQYGISEAEVEQKIAAAKEQLHKARENRIKPGLDDKCLLSWNALMNRALTKSGAVLENNSYIEQATTHMDWMWRSYMHDGALKHTWKDGNARIDAKLDDYAYLIAAMIELASATGNHSLVLKADALMSEVIANFLHEDKNFFYFSSSTQADIPVRKVDLYDATLPSANSMIADSLVQLGMLMEKSAWLEQGQYMVRQMHDTAGRYPTSFAFWGVLGQRHYNGLKTVIYTGESGEKAIGKINKTKYPNSSFWRVNAGCNDVPALALKTDNEAGGVYVCDTEACRLITDNPEQVAQMLRN